MIDHHSYTHNLNSCEIKAWNWKNQSWTEFEPMTSAIPVQCFQRSWVRILFRPDFFFFSGFNFSCVTTTINHKFISFSAVQIYDLSYIHLHLTHSPIQITGEKWKTWSTVKYRYTVLSHWQNLFQLCYLTLIPVSLLVNKGRPTVINFVPASA